MVILAPDLFHSAMRSRSSQASNLDSSFLHSFSNSRTWLIGISQPDISSPDISSVSISLPSPQSIKNFEFSFPACSWISVQNLSNFSLDYLTLALLIPSFNNVTNLLPHVITISFLFIFSRFSESPGVRQKSFTYFPTFFKLFIICR